MTDLCFAFVACYAPNQPNSKESDRNVCQENTAPSEHVDQYPTDQRTSSHCSTAATCPDTECHGAFSRSGVGMIDQGQRTRHQQGSTHTLQYASDGENGQIGCESTQGRCGGEQGQSCQVNISCPPAIP